MKSIIKIEVETRNLKQFVPEEGGYPKKYTKEELKECNETIDGEFHSAIKGTLKSIFESKENPFLEEMREKIVEVIEEVLIDDTSAYELPEIDCFRDVGEVSFKVLDKWIIHLPFALRVFELSYNNRKNINDGTLVFSVVGILHYRQGLEDEREFMWKLWASNKKTLSISRWRYSMFKREKMVWLVVVFLWL